MKLVKIGKKIWIRKPIAYSDNFKTKAKAQKFLALVQSRTGGIVPDILEDPGGGWIVTQLSTFLVRWQ